jgi:hypothetical protein
MIECAHKRYFDQVSGGRETVSLHFRLVLDSEPKKNILLRRPILTGSWYLQLMEKAFDPAKVVFFVISEDARILMPFFLNAQARISSMRFVMIEDDFATSLAVMSMCQHHIVADSKFSFWGMFDVL